VYISTGISIPFGRSLPEEILIRTHFLVSADRQFPYVLIFPLAMFVINAACVRNMMAAFVHAPIYPVATFVMNAACVMNVMTAFVVGSVINILVNAPVETVVNILVYVSASYLVPPATKVATDATCVYIAKAANAVMYVRRLLVYARNVMKPTVTIPFNVRCATDVLCIVSAAR